MFTFRKWGDFCRNCFKNQNINQKRHTVELWKTVRLKLKILTITHVDVFKVSLTIPQLSGSHCNLLQKTSFQIKILKFGIFPIKGQLPNITSPGSVMLVASHKKTYLPTGSGTLTGFRIQKKNLQGFLMFFKIFNG